MSPSGTLELPPGSRRLPARDAILSRDSLRLNACVATLMSPLSQRGNEFGK